MQRYFLIFAAISGFLTVALGAFAAHALKQQLSVDSLAIFRTGVDYQMFHALALLAISLLINQQPKTTLLKLAGYAFIIGTLLFSGSLYALALGAPRAIGIITPLGGLGFLTGWLALALFAWRSR
ncbi:MAG: DUF423 domain-containing protein [Pseudomonadota bacterium]